MGILGKFLGDEFDGDDLQKDGYSKGFSDNLDGVEIKIAQAAIIAQYEAGTNINAEYAKLMLSEEFTYQGNDDYNPNLAKIKNEMLDKIMGKYDGESNGIKIDDTSYKFIDADGVSNPIPDFSRDDFGIGQIQQVSDQNEPENSIKQNAQNGEYGSTIENIADLTQSRYDYINGL